ncbi:hypothetical protein IAR55_006324 [Kwoniella newhampshirensis]|uniref:Homeobox domain-containing protein n=1 Tax=Kwoniella newhampshirensis TaxID=1651941 RepID=A0AAW0YSG5_9TREE
MSTSPSLSEFTSSSPASKLPTSDHHNSLSTPVSSSIDSHGPESSESTASEDRNYLSDTHSLPTTPYWCFDGLDRHTLQQMLPRPPASAIPVPCNRAGPALVVDTPASAIPTVSSSDFGTVNTCELSGNVYRSATSMTAVTDWSQPSAIPSSFLSPSMPPLSQTSLVSPAIPHRFESAQHSLTGSSPMLPGFDIVNISHRSPVWAQAQDIVTRPGPIRTRSATFVPGPNNRHRSVTVSTFGSAASCDVGTQTATPLSVHPYPSYRPTHPQTPVSQSAAPARNRSVSDTINLQTQPHRVFHPSPPSSISPAIKVDLTQLPQDETSTSYEYARGRTGTGEGLRFFPPMESKAPRFKPTKQQLEILIRTYNQNQNPDSQMRDALAKQLGPDIRPKTLQIWFQNRRSKARAKERRAGLREPLQTRDRSGSSHLSQRDKSSSDTGDKRGVDREKQEEALQSLVLEDDENLVLLPISVLSIGNWTRFLTPGSGTTNPDLGATLHIADCPSDESKLYLYVVHQGDPYRIEIPLLPGAITDIHAASNPALNIEAVAIRFDLAPNAAEFGRWSGEHNRWVEFRDFTGGPASLGGRCELTGSRDILIPAFTRVQSVLASPIPVQGSASSESTLTHTTWHPTETPALSATPSIRIPALDFSAPQVVPRPVHQRQRSISQPMLATLRSATVANAGPSQPHMLNQSVFRVVSEPVSNLTSNTTRHRMPSATFQKDSNAYDASTGTFDHLLPWGSMTTPTWEDPTSSEIGTITPIWHTGMTWDNTMVLSAISGESTLQTPMTGAQGDGPRQSFSSAWDGQGAATSSMEVVGDENEMSSNVREGSPSRDHILPFDLDEDGDGPKTSGKEEMLVEGREEGHWGTEEGI